jgi:hypothetical protein
MNDGPALGPLNTQSRSGSEKICDIRLWQSTIKRKGRDVSFDHLLFKAD